MKRILLLLTFAAVIFAAHSAYGQDEVGNLLGRINSLRAGVGRAPYTLNGALSAAAQDQAQWIVATGTVAHTRPDGNGVRSRVLANGYGTTDVSENIYGGTNATANDAWGFWVTSGIHYRGLVNERYQEIGIGVARGSWGAAFVLVFGNPGGAPPPAAAANSAAGPAASVPDAAPAGPPSYVRGLDEQGNILHEVQPGETLGDILLIYGYTWETLPYIMQINGITNVRDLEVGSILKVPPQAGTYTPTAPAATKATLTPTFAYPTPYPEETLIVSTMTPATIATAAALPELLVASVATVTVVPTPTATASATPIPVQANSPVLPATSTSNVPLWIVIGLALQVVVLIGAGIEYLRKLRRK